MLIDPVVLTVAATAIETVAARMSALGFSSVPEG
jgi:hypothetical protein